MKSFLLTLVFLFAAASVYSQSFTKITSGIMVNDGGASRSVNWIDIDNDNDLDLFVSNGLTGGEDNFMYRNDNGTFVKITNSVVVQDSTPSDGSSWADFDNDGKVDMCVVNWYLRNDLLYKNNGNFDFTFLSTSPVSTSGGSSETCSWGDYDNDGNIDLVITNSGNNAAPNQPEFLFKNNRNGTFTKIDTGIIVTDGKFTRGCNWVDADNDRDLDLFVCNERGQNENLFINNGNGYFTKLLTGSLVTNAGETWSSSWGDHDNDGDFDVVVSNWNGRNSFFRNDGSLNFTKIDTGAIVAEVNFAACTGWGDYDNDGDLDLFITNGYHVSGNALKNFLFKNMLMESGTAYFQKVTAGDIVNDLTDSFGFAWGDYDSDGDLDVFVATTRNENSNNLLYRNDNSNGNKWIDIKCTGITSNKSGIGAKVKVKAVINGSPVWQVQEVDGQSGYCGQNLNLHFGLGNAAVIDSIKVEWPSGANDYYTNVAVNNFYKAFEGQSFTLSVNTINTEIPKKFTLHQNYPNPFNPVTKIQYQITRAGSVKLEVYDAAGKEVAVLLNSEQRPGTYEVTFDGANLASGMYIYKLTAEGLTESKKMLLIK